MTTKEFLDALKDALTEELKTKTGWGRNEVLSAFERAVTTVLVRQVKIS